MGSIAADELSQWGSATEETPSEREKIKVSIRLRPLNEDELSRNDLSDWECINKNTIAFRNCLTERSAPPIAYTFDRVFCCESSTRQVYEEAAKEVAMSAVSGINASIFAYGQTSSGKTYTMTGLTEMAAADIYDYIQRHKDREFLLKFSAMEIYNESVRDLLSDDNTPLRLLDGPDRSTIIEKLTEEVVNGWDHIMQLLSMCEAQREVGETLLNKTSSRSHQIIRLTIESSACEFVGLESSGSLVASVHFVDLAGSERASQAMSAGARLKEGCHINRSLLTLGTVIRKLSQGNNGHIPYRDSKLTRILQQSLGGNARTAIVCTMSPARSHIEQSRNTLLFATCAKEVITSAEVNIVMSDKALVKHLQRELARLESELRRPRLEPTTDELLRQRDDRIQQMEKDIWEITRQRDQARAKLEELLSASRHEAESTHQFGLFQGGLCRDRSPDFLSPLVRMSECPSFFSPERKEILCPERREILSPETREILSPDNAHKIEEQCKEVQCEVEVRKEMEEWPPSIIQRAKWERNFGGFLMESSSCSSLQEEEQGQSTPPGSSVHSESYRCSRPEDIRRRLFSLRFGVDGDPASPSSATEWAAEKSHSLEDKDSLQVLSRSASVGKQSSLEETDSVQKAEVRPRIETDRQTKDAGIVDPIMFSTSSLARWEVSSPARSVTSSTEDFERRRMEIIDLWQACNVSILHRTYFFLLCLAGPGDPIYLELEIRRLDFLRRALSGGHVTLISPSSIAKAVRRERGMLCRRMRRRLTAAEREALYQKWSISLQTKQRRMQLARRVWTMSGSITHASESAAVVGKVLGEPSNADKEMLVLSFSLRPDRSFS